MEFSFSRIPVDTYKLREKKQWKKGSMKEVKEGSRGWIEGEKETEGGKEDRQEERTIFFVSY
jgi:hypothetical protein